MAKVAKTVFCIMALVLLLAVGMVSLRNAYDHERIPRILEGASTADEALNDSLPGRETMLAPYRALNAALGTRYFPADFTYVLSNGQMVKAQRQQDVTPTVDATVGLARYCEEHDVNFEYIVLPAKPEYDADLEDVGIACGRNANADAFLASIREEGIICHDLRELSHDGYYDMFYKTDLHWTVDAGFAATRQMVDWLNQDFGYRFDLERLDSSRFTRTVYPDCYVGEIGRSTLGPFGDVEDFVVIQPDYDVNLHYVSPQQGIDRSGGFDILLHDEYMEDPDNVIRRNRYYYYLGGNYNEVEITNDDVDEGNVLIVKDSYAMVVAPFFSLTCNHVVLWDMREDTHIYEYLEQHPEIETVVILYNAGSCANMDYHDFQ